MFRQPFKHFNLKLTLSVKSDKEIMYSKGLWTKTKTKAEGKSDAGYN